MKQVFALFVVLFVFVITQAQPANNNCSGAINMAWTGYQTSQQTGTVQNATQSIVPINCGGTSYNALDVWYQFTAIAAQTSIICTPTSGLDVVIDVRHGSSCNGTNVGCADSGGGDGGGESVIVTTTPGDNYYVRIYDYNGTGNPPTTYTFYLQAVVYGGANYGDLVIQNASLGGASSVPAGGTVTASCTVLNQANVSCGATSTLQYWLVPSNNTTCDFNNVTAYLDNDNVANLSGNSSGNESATLTIPSNTTPGNYKIMFWADQGGTVTEYNETNNTYCLPITVTTAPQYGSVSVTLNPSGAVTNGAQWNLDGGAWQSSGTTLSNISTGAHTVNFSSATGYSAPSSQNITVVANQTNNVTGTYTLVTQYGSVNTTLSPSGAVTNGAQWNLDGGAWQSSGATLSNISTGAHTVNFSSATGYSAPSSQNITVIANQTNNVTGTYTLTGTNPTIQVIYPNGGETWVIGSAYNIIATITGNLGGVKNIDVSYDGGVNWNYIGATSASSINYSWTPSYIPSAQCKVRVRGNYQGNTISDVSDANFTIQASLSGQGFGLSSSSTSHLYWPYSGSNWDDNPSAVIRDGWKSGNEGGGGSPQGTGGHMGGEFHAQDWNRVTSPDYDCQKNYLAPLSGTVIYAHGSCSPFCFQNCTLTNGQCCGNGFGNTVIIRSDDDNEFAFRVSHLYSTNVITGQHVSHGDILGTVGMTGNGTGSHAHCTLYKNITSVYQTGITALQRITAGSSLGFTGSNSNFAANYILDAVVGGAGGGMPENPIIAATQTFICPGGSTTLTAMQGVSFYWNTGDTSQSIVVNTPGNYSVLVNDGNGNLTTSQTISVSQVSTTAVHIITPTTTLCQGSSLELNASTIVPDSIGDFFDDDVNVYSWSTGATASGITVTQAGTYYLTFNDGFGCASNSDSITITMINSPSQPTIQINNSVQLASNTISGCTYQWYLNGIAIPNATTQFLTADTSGYYTVAAINASGCSTLSDPAFITVLAIEEINLFSNLNIYPNPNNGRFTLSLKSETEKKVELTCLNLMGEIVYVKQFELNNGELKTELNLSSVAKGLYLVRITANGKSIYRKVTITE